MNSPFQHSFSYSSPTSGSSVSDLLKEVTMTTTSRNNNSTLNNNIYRQSNLPRKRLFATKNYGGSMKSINMNRKLKYVLIFVGIFVFGILFITMSFTLPTSDHTSINYVTSPKQVIEDLQVGLDTSRNNSVPLVTTMDKNEGSNNNTGENEIEQNEKDRHSFNRCDFRKYKPNRYYKVPSSSPPPPSAQNINNDNNNNNNEIPPEPFLAEADYIRGKQPFVLNSNSKISSSSSFSSLMPHKLCLNTSDWEDVKPGHYPFSDGQNPSIVSLASNVYNLPETGYEYKDRLDKDYIKPLANIYNEEYHDYQLHDLFLGLLLFGDSQCRWNLNDNELEEMKFSSLMEPPSKRSMVIVLNEGMNIIDSTVLQLELDAKWGTRKKLQMKKNDDGSYEKNIVELDDARLFFHNGQLHVLYRNGPYYGYESKFF